MSRQNGTQIQNEKNTAKRGERTTTARVWTYADQKMEEVGGSYLV